MEEHAVWNDRTLVFLDIETTGLEPARDKIIEVGAVKFCGREVGKTMHLLVRPGVAVPEFITDLTGITDRDLEEEGVEVSRAMAATAEFIGSLPLVGHHIAFDLSFLQAAGLAPANPVMDTRLLAKIALPRLESYRLGFLAQRLLGETAVHRGLSDAEQTGKLFWTLVDRLSVRRPEELLRLAGVTSKSCPLLAELFGDIAKWGHKWGQTSTLSI